MNNKKIKNKKINNGMKFFLIMLLIYFFMFLISKYLVIDALYNTISTFFKIIPIFFIVFIFMFITNLYIQKNKENNFFNKKEKQKRQYVFAIIAGILIAGPPYVLYPMLGDFKNKGVSNSVMAVFFYNRNIKIPFIPIMIFYFGFIYTIIVSLLIIVFSIFNGIIVGKLTDN